MSGLCCFRCGLEYGSDFWADVVITNPEWEQIAPKEGGGGVLCFSCMNKALLEAGLDGVPAMIASGPMAAEQSPTQVYFELRQIAEQIEKRAEGFSDAAKSGMNIAASIIRERADDFS